MKAVEHSANSTFCYNSSNAWVGYRLDMIAIVFVISTTALSVLGKNYFNKDLLILTLNIIVDVIVLFSFSIRLFAEI